MNVPSVLHPPLAVAVVAAVSFGSLRLYAWRAAKEPPKQAMSRIRLALAVGLPLTALLALFALLLTDSLDTTDAALRAASPSLADSPAGAAATWVPTLAGMGVATVAGYLGAFPYVSEVRDIDVSAVEAAGSMARLVAVSLVLVAAGFGASSLLADSGLSGPAPLFGLLLAFVVVLLGIQPRLVAFQNDVREPTDAERERLVRLCERAGLTGGVGLAAGTGRSLPSLRILETDANPIATALFPGLPGNRRLFVTDVLLENYDDDEVAAVLASKTGRVDRYYREYKIGVILVVGGLLLSLVSGDLTALTGVEPGALAVGVLALTVGLLWYGKQLLLAADDYAVERVGARTFVETLEAVADEHQVSYESGRVRSLLLMRPSVGARLDRLWGRIEE